MKILRNTALIASLVLGINFLPLRARGLLAATENVTYQAFNHIRRNIYPTHFETILDTTGQLIGQVVGYTQAHWFKTSLSCIALGSYLMYRHASNEYTNHINRNANCLDLLLTIDAVLYENKPHLILPHAQRLLVVLQKRYDSSYVGTFKYIRKIKRGWFYPNIYDYIDNLKNAIQHIEICSNTHTIGSLKQVVTEIKKWYISEK